MLAGRSLRMLLTLPALYIQTQKPPLQRTAGSRDLGVFGLNGLNAGLVLLRRRLRARGFRVWLIAGT